MTKSNVRLTTVGMTEFGGERLPAVGLDGGLARSEWVKIEHLMTPSITHCKLDSGIEEPVLVWIVIPERFTECAIAIEEILEIPYERSFAAQLSGVRDWGVWTITSIENNERRQREIILDGRSLCEKYPKMDFYLDNSWNDAQQHVGEVIDESEYWKIHEYLFGVRVIGNCIEAKQNNPVDPVNVVPGLMLPTTFDVNGNANRFGYVPRGYLLSNPIEIYMGEAV